MAAGASAALCLAGSFQYNGTLCACLPGKFLTGGGESCVEFDAPPGMSVVGSEVGLRSPVFLSELLPLDSIQRFTRSQAVVLTAALGSLALWLVFCLVVRMGRVDSGRSVWFRIRWWISRLDFFFDTHHLQEDRQLLRIRKTELGGTFSVASWILFVGLLSTLLYQIISQRSIEVHRFRPATAPDLQSFVMDMEFNITAVSSMSCSHLHGLDILVTGSPGFIDYRESPLSTYVNSSCYNSSIGPVVSLTCINCQIPLRNHYISWYFADLPNDPAMAVGFIFNLTAKVHADSRHVTFFNGTLKSASLSVVPATFRGPDSNILKINLFPQIYNNLHNLKIIQPLFHDFIPGTFFTDEAALKSSLHLPKAGLVNTTLFISYISDYIVEIDNSSHLNGPVSVLADIGGLYSISFAIFLYLLWQCEARMKKFRNEDYVMVDIRSRKRAKRNWDKLRKYVMYTWSPRNMTGNDSRRKRGNDHMIDSFRRNESMLKTKHPSRKHTEHLENMTTIDIDSGVVRTSELQ